MSERDLREQAQQLRFEDPAVEAAYQAERGERDVARTRRVTLVIVVMGGLLGLINATMSGRLGMPLPRGWMVLRFGVMVPALLLIWFLAGRPWGKRHLQDLLGFGFAFSGGAFALEWLAEWTPATPLRALWVVPTAVLWGILMTLPFNARAALIAMVGTLGLGVLGAFYFLPQVGRLLVATMALAFLVTFGAFRLFCRWREYDWRMLFVHRREAERLTAQLQAKNDELQRLIEQRNDFVAGVLHDLRSPLTGIILGADVLRGDDTLPPAIRDVRLGEIGHAARRVASFAERFLEQRALEHAAETPVLADVSLDPVVERAVAGARLKAGRKQQQIILAPAVPAARVVADELLLDRAIGNLLDNAVKYSPHGAAITVSVTVDDAVPPQARVAVSDTGPGLSAQERARLFQPYVILGKKPTGGEPSTGIGLSLVKHCISKMGGTVGCESAPGRGSTFWVALKTA